MNVPNVVSACPIQKHPAGAHQGGRGQAGFTLIELLIVIAAIGFLAYVLMPQWNNIMASSSVTPVAKDLNQFAMDAMRNAAQTDDGDPYTNLNQTLLASALERSHLKVRSGGVVRHNLGGGDAGTVTLANSGTEFTLTTSKLGPAACPDFITQMQVNAVKVTVNGTTVKALDDNNNITTAYSVTKTQAACTKGDTNEGVFTFR